MITSYLETSAKDALNVEQAFIAAASAALKRAETANSYVSTSCWPDDTPADIFVVVLEPISPQSERPLTSRMELLQVIHKPGQVLAIADCTNVPFEFIII